MRRLGGFPVLGKISFWISGGDFEKISDFGASKEGCDLYIFWWWGGVLGCHGRKNDDFLNFLGGFQIFLGVDSEWFGDGLGEV